MYKLKLRAIGDEVGVVFPREMLTHLEAKIGDELHAVARTEGYIVSRYDFETLRQPESGREIMREDREALKALAKL